MRVGTFPRHAFFIKLLAFALTVLAGSLFVMVRVDAVAGGCGGGSFPNSTGGRCQNHGYYTNQKIGGLYTSPWTWKDGHVSTTYDSTSVQPINTVDDYVKYVEFDLTQRGNYSICPSPTTNTGCTQNQGTLVGTSMMVNLMLGMKGQAFNNKVQNGIDYARTHFTEWKKRVYEYNAAGLIDISNNIKNLPAGRPDSLAFNYGADAGFYIANDTLPAESIVFRNPNGNGSAQFQINKLCGNVFGDANGLQDLDYPFQLGGSSTTLLNDEESPTSVKFTNTVVSLTTGPNGVINPTTIRHFYVKHSNGSTSPLSSLGAIPGTFVNTPTDSIITDASKSYGAAPANSSFTDAFTFTTPLALALTDRVCTYITRQPAIGHTDAQGNIVDAVSNSPPFDDENCDGIVAKPYMQVYGGDVVTGGGVGAVDSSGTLVCDPNSGLLATNFDINSQTASIVGWNREDDPLLPTTGQWTGAGGQYGVRATGGILDFASNYQVTSNAGRPVSLSFANDGTGVTVDATNGAFGGNFNASSEASCDPGLFTLDDFNNAPVGPIKTTVKLPGVSVSGNTTLYVKGDIYIDQNEVYAGGGTYASVIDIPSLKIVSLGGNIYIDHDVTQLDGTYYAIPKSDGTGGTIYTCANAGLPITGSTNLTDCNRQLVVNGSFVANQIHFLRSIGSLKLSKTDTDVYVPGAGNNAAEVFNYSPEVWINPGQSTTTSKYDSVKTLPPVL